jgi:tRNA modification GTPase
MMRLDDTITAISTPIGTNGIGIVRLSGPEALSVADKVFLPADGKRPSEFASHTLRYGWIVNSSQFTVHSSQKKKNLQSGIVDEVLLTVMRAPKTYTKEDIVEINCHSGIVILKSIMELLLKSGARLALPGEFTKRAYLNGRIDLVQAEAVMDVINSQTQDALNAALGQLQGRLSGQISALRDSLVDILARLEASIDFSDQPVEPFSREELLKQTQVISQSVKRLLDSADKGTMLREGVTCVICGKPNVGKSSLLNALLKRDRAIVTPVPGTTRDSLEETIDLCGIPLRLVDTAGIMRATDLAEKEAVKRSRRCLQEAALVLLVLDAGQKLAADDFKIAGDIGRKPALVILNKQDLPAKIDICEAQNVLPGRKVLSVSALRGTAMDRLEKEIADFIWQGKAVCCDELLITNIRHKEALIRAQKSLARAVKAVKGRGAEIVALEMKEAQASLGQIIGDISCEDILERIFSQFCIGK